MRCVELLRNLSRVTDRLVFQALFRDMNNNFRMPKKNKKDDRPWDLPTTKESLAHTLLGHSFFTATVDEAHQMRNAGNRHSSALKLLERATVRLIMTATPLHTSSKVSQ
jgi:hypothetical protein